LDAIGSVHCGKTGGTLKRKRKVSEGREQGGGRKMFKQERGTVGRRNHDADSIDVG